LILNGSGKIVVDPSSLRGKNDVPNPEGPPNPSRSGMARLGFGVSAIPRVRAEDEAKATMMRTKLFMMFEKFDCFDSKLIQY
jgi:hypothetical protein